MRRRAPDFTGDRDDIIIAITERGGSLETAIRVISEITECFYLLAQYPYLGRDRNDDLGGMRRSYLVGQSMIIYRIDARDVLIVRVIDGRRDIEALFH